MGSNALSSCILIQNNFVTHESFVQDEYMKSLQGLSFYELRDIFDNSTWFGYPRGSFEAHPGSFGDPSEVRQGPSGSIVCLLSGKGGGSVRRQIVTTFGELIWTALQIETWFHHPINFLETFWGFDVCLLGVRLPKSVCSPLGLFWASDSNQSWRADLKSSPNLESWFVWFSKLKPGLITNKFLRVCCWVKVHIF